MVFQLSDPVALALIAALLFWGALKLGRRLRLMIDKSRLEIEADAPAGDPEHDADSPQEKKRVAAKPPRK